ncbi:MAG TPA: AtpZ/AtpI family protein [Ignavibacteriaceae bacterium]|nr:AtpZ/AtpI family protein [Ignavibacteriaceae bacterium]
MKNKDENEDGRSNFAVNYGPYLGLGLQLAVTVVVMVFLGIWLDDKFGTNPWLTVIFSFLGIAAALYNFLKSVLKSDK